MDIKKLEKRKKYLEQLLFLTEKEIKRLKEKEKCKSKKLVQSIPL